MEKEKCAYAGKVLNALWLHEDPGGNTVTPPAPGSNLLYDQQVATDQQYLAQRQTPSAPTSAQYIQAI